MERENWQGELIPCVLLLGELSLRKQFFFKPSFHAPSRCKSPRGKTSCRKPPRRNPPLGWSSLRDLSFMPVLEAVLIKVSYGISDMGILGEQSGPTKDFWLFWGLADVKERGLDAVPHEILDQWQGFDNRASQGVLRAKRPSGIF